MRSIRSLARFIADVIHYRRNGFNWRASWDRAGRTF